MQKVSKAYSESMKSPLRERAYIMVSFGVVNQEIQRNATLEQGDFAYYANTKNIFAEKTDIPVYATLEEDFTKVDGTMYFLPRKKASNFYISSGIVSDKLLSEAQFEITIHLNTLPTDFKGITIDFGEDYPVSFDMVSSTGQTVEIRDNTQSLFTSEEVLANTTEIKLVFYQMKNPNSRVRIYYIQFGYGLTYSNEDVISSTLDSYVSPIGADVPTVDFEVQLKNYDRYFNVDNPKSAINFLETGQPMEVYYGYQLPDTDEIEWIKGNTLQCSEWESDDKTATIRCQDVFRTMDSMYYKGKYSASGKSYYDLAVEILQDAGVTDYYIDPRLKTLYTKNPVPRVQHKEALQIIANACRCVLSQTRSGEIQIKSAYVSEATATADTQAPYSQVANILNGEAKDEYAALSGNYTTADGSMYFLPRTLGIDIKNTGFVSAELSGEDGAFTSNPKVTLTREIACTTYGLTFQFGAAVPVEFIVRTYNNGTVVTERTVTAEEIGTKTILSDRFEDFDTMVLEFTKTAEPYSRIVLNNVTFGDETDFTMTRTDMTCSPKAIKQELVKDVVVPCYVYQSGEKEETIVSEEVTVEANDTETFYMDVPYYNLRATLDEKTTGITITEWGNYYVTVQFTKAGTYQLEIFGYQYSVIEKNATKTLHLRGKTVTWENPLISDSAMAKDLAAWLGDYYQSGIEYEYTTRGNPELDVDDIIRQENDFKDNMQVNVYRQTLYFNGSFSGKVTARRIGG